MWECPDFYPVSLRGNTGVDTSQYGDGFKHVLKNSLDATRYEYYTVGTYYREKDRYVPDMTSADDQSGLRYDYGNFYASKTFYDSGKNRRILWGWSNETDSVKDDVTKGWSGIQCGSERTIGRRMRSFSSLTSSPMGIWLLLFEVYHAGIRNPRAASLAFSGGGITGDPGSNSPLIQQYIAHSPFQLL